jgi:FlaA1/EpsC-like NDP-sugar epimerase
MGKVLVDGCVLSVAFCLAFVLRFEGAIPYYFAEIMLSALPLVVAGKMILLAVSGQERVTWRFFGLYEAVRLGGWLGLASVVVLAWRLFLPVDKALPIGVIVLELVLSYVGLVGVRALARLLCEKGKRRGGKAAAERIPTLLIGAGRAGALLAREIRTWPGSGIELVGFLDDDRHLHGLYVEGLPVLGPTEQLAEVCRRHPVRQAIIAIADAPATVIRRLSRLCEGSGLRTKIIPPLHEIVEGRISLSKIREVSIDDLLRRPPVNLDCCEIEQIVRGQVVMVTGAGGSIGSELCRIIARLQPKSLILVEQAENSLFHIHGELQEALPELELVPTIADICDYTRMDAIFEEHRPSLVFHAAAHKHVPMMEWNPGEAVKNNVLGTRTIASLADAWRVERFVMISTDKAVNPTSVMGVSKRVAELYIQALGQQSKTRFMTVRFGNVLGSAGSVIPTFKRQIASGGPITVTHPEMRRFFMTIPEACQLVLQAASMGKGGELFILDMGEPVKILDLARDLIRLSGLAPEDVEIRFTGLRPGEKLFEELSHHHEDLLKTAHPRIFIGKVKVGNYLWINRQIDQLGELTSDPDNDLIIDKFKEIIPEYQGRVQLRSDAATGSPVQGAHDRGVLSFTPKGLQPN